LAELDFEYCEGIDCWSRKGALLAEGEFQGQTFQILGTHLEAGPIPRARIVVCSVPKRWGSSNCRWRF
jgi:hypothetical protein